MIYQNLNTRQIRCLAALRTGKNELTQAHEASAAWHAITANNEIIRLSLTGGDVWMLNKMGLIERMPEQRRFTMPKSHICLMKTGKKSPSLLKNIKRAA